MHTLKNNPEKSAFFGGKESQKETDKFIWK